MKGGKSLKLKNDKNVYQSKTIYLKVFLNFIQVNKFLIIIFRVDMKTSN